MKRPSFFLGLIMMMSCSVQSDFIKNNVVVDDRDGYVLKLDNNNQELKAGQSLSFGLNILRSRCYANKPVTLKIDSPLPGQLSFSIDPHPVTADRVTVEVNSTANIKKGEYTLMVCGDALRPGMHLKATAFKLTVI